MDGKTLLLLLLVFTPWAAGSAVAEDSAPVDWQGFYIGLHGGGGLGLADVSDPYGRSIFGDTVRAPGFLLGGQIGHNWQAQSTVFGLEAGLGWADMGGTNTCFAWSGSFFSSNCEGDVDAAGTLAARLGWTLPFDGRTLVYGKAGLGAAHVAMEATPAGDIGLAGSGTSGWRWGWMLGAGVERAISQRWSVTAEYNFLRFEDIGFNSPASRSQPLPSPDPRALVAVNSFPASASSDMHLVKLGLNYHFGDTAADDTPPALAAAPAQTHDTSFEVGARYVHGWSQFHKDLGIPGPGTASPASRLTYDSPSLNGIEAFARLDTSFGLMVKGLVGGARGDSGKLNDEDWGILFDEFYPYSNTISSADNEVGYWSIDVGYDVWREAGVTITPFVGYVELRQDMSANGCVQIATPPSVCASPIPTSTLVITEDDTWRAVRLGIAVDLELAPHLTLSGEVAYLPYVNFSGTDDHVLRSLVSPEDGRGNGVQLEAMLSYALTEAWRVGVGGRYWSMWTTSGDVSFGGEETIPMRYAVEQAQLLVELSYKLGAAAK